MHQTKQNEISAIIAKKGSGKSLFATALALSQDKPTFYITPLEDSYYLLPCDSVNYKNYQPNQPLQINYIEVTDREQINKELQRIKNISKNSENGVLLIIDEADYYSNSRLHYKSEIFNIINYGRHAQLNIIFIARRIQDIPANIVTNCDKIYLGVNNNIENDLKYYKQFFRDEVIKYSAMLKTGKFISYDTRSDKISITYINQKTANLIQRKCKNE